MAQLGFRRRAVIAGKEDERVLSQIERIELIDETAHHCIHAFYHLAVIHPAIFARRIRHLPLEVIGYIVCQCHRVKCEERFTGLAILLHEFAEKIDVNIWPVSCFQSGP